MLLAWVNSRLMFREKRSTYWYLVNDFQDAVQNSAKAGGRRRTGSCASARVALFLGHQTQHLVVDLLAGTPFGFHLFEPLLAYLGRRLLPLFYFRWS